MNLSRLPRSQYSFSWLYFLATALITFAPLIFARHVNAADSCSLKAAHVESVQGIVEIRRFQSTSWELVALDTPLCAGDTLRVRRHSRAAIRLNNNTVMRLDQRTTITITRTEDNKITSLTELIEGIIHIITRTPVPFRIKTPFLNAGVEGTEFTVELAPDHTRMVMFEGRVTASNEYGSVQLTDHEAAIAYSNQAPYKETIVKPLDAVQWALYYPAILGYHRDQHNVETSNLLSQAEHLLSVGQADEARTIIKRLLADNPDNSEAIALKSIIAVVQNDKKRALELANRAVALDDLSVPARLALSYAQQAAFDIDEALDSIKQAVILDPQNALIQARLSELYMSVGEFEQALEAAQEAVSLNPLVAKTQTVLGFAHLLQINTQKAQSIFREAILLDQTDPMPRLGLGLALIREGQLEAGRIELEIAAILDPGNSLIRSYLGKAYFEEKRYSLAETQFKLAREHDPLDPTPWFYDAIQKQTQNRPVEALQDIQKSIELNDNRAVYRSKLLLDQDQAGRSSSLARIYDNLGFEKRAIVETAKSLAADPSNHSAHRFLSDTYARLPRHEVARVSELLQAQLLQPINVNPVQPHAVVPDLNIITNTGPFSTGFNEFAPLMERNKPQLVASGVVGNQGTLGNEMVFSQLYDRTSISLGQFHYETNGFRPNNDQKHNIYNAFIQHAFSPKLNIQAEIRTHERIYGDLRQTFDPKDYFNFRTNKRDDTVHIGSRYSFSQHQHFITSGIFADRNFKMDLGSSDHISKDIQNYQAEALFLHNGNNFNFVSGGSYYQLNTKDKNNNFNLGQIIRSKKNVFLYSNWLVKQKFYLTLGLSYDSYTRKSKSESAIDLSFDAINPKLGLQWDILHQLRLRLAWFKTTKNNTLAHQSIEPTQVAGFNQFFDDPDGTRAERMGIGLDFRPTETSYSGLEASIRDLKVPFSNIDIFDKQKEQLYRAYYYITFLANWSVNSEFQFEKYHRTVRDGITPNEIQTIRIPISINYFNSEGIYSKLTGTYINQNLKQSGNLNSDFFLMDASIGYRLPKRKGLITFEAKNLLDQHFHYRDPWFFVSEPSLAQFVPMRTFFAKLTLNF